MSVDPKLILFKNLRFINVHARALSGELHAMINVSCLGRAINVRCICLRGTCITATGKPQA